MVEWEFSCCTSLFSNFKQLNIKAVVAHHHVTYNEIDKQLAKGATEPSTCGTGFYSNVFVVLRCTGGL